MQAMQALLADADMGTLLLLRLTVKEAGRLAGACRTARVLVRRGELDMDRKEMFRPMWNTDAVLARLERYREPLFSAGGLQFRETTALARLLLDELLPAGVFELRFKLESARAGEPPSLLGCHELRVVQRLRWVQSLQDWALRDCSCFSYGLDDDLGMRQKRRRHPGSYMIDLLRDLGLQPTRQWEWAVEPLPTCLEACWRLQVRVWVT
jgi:hypothetical protein